MGRLALTELDPCAMDGVAARRFSLSNSQGVAVGLMEYGATVLAVSVPGTNGPVTLTRGLASPLQYQHNPAYFGATCGRFSGRIANGRCRVGDTEVVWSSNDGVHCLHGGAVGFNKRLWVAQPLASDNPNQVGVCFTYVSPDGESGFPGELDCQVCITLDDNNGLQFDYRAAVVGRPTLVNLTNHSYWNLADEPTILGHQLQLTADRVLVLDEHLIPTGERRPVKGTAFDFRQPHIIGEQFHKLSGQALGFDDCFVQRTSVVGELQPVATLVDPASGRGLTVLTDQPGVVLYTGNYLDGSAEVGGAPRYGGVALECQQLPDAPNHAHFPSTMLVPGEIYRQSSRYEISLPRR